MAESEATTSNKWTKRDVLTFVAFNLIIMAVTMVLKMVEDMLLIYSFCHFSRSGRALFL